MKRLVEEDPMWDALSILRLDTGTAKDDKSLPQASVVSSDGAAVALWACSGGVEGGDSGFGQCGEVCDVVGVVGFGGEGGWSDADGEHDGVVGSDGVGAAVGGSF